MIIDRDNFSRYLNDELDRIETNYEKKFRGAFRDARQKITDKITALSNKIFDGIQVGYNADLTRIEINTTSKSLIFIDSVQCISSFLSTEYKIDCSTTSKKPLTRLNAAVGATLLDFLQAQGQVEIKTIWKIDWSANRTLRLHPRDKPLLPKVPFAATAIASDLKHNQQRITGQFCDVTFEVEGVAFPLHRATLASSSPYFERMFLSSLKEAKPYETFTIQEVSKECFSLYVTTLYCKQPPEKELSFELLVELFSYTHLTQTAAITDWCVIELVQKLTIDTFYQIALHANKIKNKTLLDYCAYFFEQNEASLISLDLSELSESEQAELLEVMQLKSI